ncbi:hypothetical protein NE237_021554 [Protea cynaroides]|uniref:RNA helicase n=1 Tax=Protea cynaroides TaxID=273540 RepID=A0A9Q0HDI2_9MAGN|nr:hypothetical protein NE237_021554 [Protea cynaroides]
MRPQLVLFGDSITEQSFRRGGWGAALADTYSRKADVVVVRGYGGYNTRWALFLLHLLFPLECTNPPLATTIFFGANDAALSGRNNERQHVPVEEYKENLRRMVNHLKKCSPTMLVVLITPPPVDEEGRLEYARSVYGEKAVKLPERTNEMAGVYAKQCVELARELGLPSIDLWSKMQEAEKWRKKFLSDGLHLTEGGNAVLHQEVARAEESSVFLGFPSFSNYIGDQLVMAATATATVPSSGPRYAPEDPTLPKPWRGLVDGNTGYLYFWNPDTNVTQYERPVASSHGGQPAPPKSSAAPLSSSVQIQQSSQGQHRNSSNVEDLRYQGNADGSKFAASSGSRNHQSSKGGSAYGNGLSAQAPRSTTRGHGSTDTGSGLSAESYRRQHEITVSGDNVPAPFTSFESSGFPAEILREAQNAGFSAPTPIQAQSWPIALQSRDIVAIAKTGSGKTLGYLIPGFIHLKRRRNNSQQGPTVLILSPTRELATQIQDEAVKFSRSSRISCTCLYGGAPKPPQLRELDRGADIVVATPGRLNDILEMRRISLRQVSYLVLDEADRMLDMGFEPQIRTIVKEIPAQRQTLMYTATWPKEVRKIAADLLVNPVQVNIGNIDELVANKSITQYVEVVAPMEKQRRLEQILRSQEPGSKCIVFCSTKKMCDQLARTLARQFGAAAIHGDKSQGERDYVLNQFRSGRSPILVATDVAARGLDIKDIRVVLNYDFPTGIEDYVHRIGRTGRAGATGMAYTFFGEQDAKHASDLVKVLEGANQKVPPVIRDMAARGGGMGRSRRQWGSGGRDGGRGGYNDSSFGGRSGRGGPSSSGRSDRGRGGWGQDRDLRDGYGGGYNGGNDVDARGRNDRSHPVRSRSRSRSPIGGGAGWGRSRSRSRSRSVERNGRVPPVSVGKRDASPNGQGTFRGDPSHVRRVSKWGEKPQSPSDRRGGNTRESYDPSQQLVGEYGGGNGHSSPYRVEEEEEGIIPADEDGMIPPDDEEGMVVGGK